MSLNEYEAFFVRVEPQEGVRCHSMFCHNVASWLFVSSEILLCEDCYLLNRDNEVCPYCGKWYAKQLTHCPHCGWVFNPITIVPGLVEWEGGLQHRERKKTGLETIVARVSPEHMAWHKGFQVAVVCKFDGSLCVRYMHGETLYEYPARDSSDVLKLLGERIACDAEWRLL